MITKDEIIRRAREKHGDKYDYSLVEDAPTMRHKMKIICPVHGVFEQIIRNHLRGDGCIRCRLEKPRKTQFTKEQFLEYVEKTHDDLEKYDFSNLPEQFDLPYYAKPVTFICKKHGEFTIKYNKFLNGEDCPYCTGKKKTDEQYRELLSKLHPELDFSLANFSECDSSYKITVICPKHGVKHPRIYHLLNGEGGCNECRYGKIKEKEKLPFSTFIGNAHKVHGEKYDLSKVVYVNSHTKVEIVCPKHGSFWTTPTSFVSRKSGCPICNNSHLEDELSRFLNENNIKSIPQKSFKWLGLQRLDFYLPEYNVGIECQGIQHFKVTNYVYSKPLTNEEYFEYNVSNDIKKYERCKENGLTLLYFTYPVNFKKEYYDNVTYGSIYHRGNVFFNKEKLLNKIKGLKE